MFCFNVLNDTVNRLLNCTDELQRVHSLTEACAGLHSAGVDKSTPANGPTPSCCCFAYRVSVQQSLNFTILWHQSPTQEDTSNRTSHHHMECRSLWRDMSNPGWWGKDQASSPVVWRCICSAPASCPSPCWCRLPWSVPVCPPASETAATFSTCRHHLQGWREPAWGGSARSMQTNYATPRCTTAVAASPSTLLTSLRSLMGRGGWTLHGCMSPR